ncbi:EamA family transporter RarD [Novosphingobium ginsenosidimutans]|uniref:EamA family transporter RarD n=1 Tax=Novosphingobium ginsenosidimutans TaxID=1176536 RepID=A0A5B8S1T1_9SPHN|nr:EamA family transporter RarD [Novosphingobium ginsenosidimutans]QEA15068.1 EamA family transporter RarD [Novosphingobium ginsenosidimutans]
MHTPAPHQRSGGLPLALGAHLIWGLLPLYLWLVAHIPAVEFVGWRVISSLPLCLAILAWRGQLGEVRTAFAQPRTRWMLLASSVLIGINWLVYVAAIQAGEVYAASIGYYVTPLFSVLAGTVFLNEKLTRRQWLAVAISTLGVLLMAWEALASLGISIVLALSWTAYGFVRKLAPVNALTGLTVEVIVLLLPALAIASWFAQSPAGSAILWSWKDAGLIVLSGVVTAAPLVLFAMAAQRLAYSTMGMIQFLSPSMVFLVGLLFFGKPLGTAQLASFALIWAAIALFVIDLLARTRRA